MIGYTFNKSERSDEVKTSEKTGSFLESRSLRQTIQKEISTPGGLSSAQYFVYKEYRIPLKTMVN